MTDPHSAWGELVTPALRELLRAQALVLRRPVWGRRHGRHASARAGVGLDFRDHRPYTPGDDARALDWRAVARQDRLVLRQTESEDELVLVLVLDCAAGMNYGSGEQHKLQVASSVAGGLAWLALRQGDPVGLAIGRGGSIELGALRPLTGIDRLATFARVLGDMVPAGHCPWTPLLASIAPRLPRRSLVVVLSDFLDPAGPATPDHAEDELLRGLVNLRARGHDVVAVQVLHRHELDFPWTGRRTVRFEDLRGVRPDIEAPGAFLRAGYLERLQAYLETLEQRCEQGGIHLHRFVTDRPIAAEFLSLLARLQGGDEPARGASRRRS